MFSEIILKRHVLLELVKRNIKLTYSGPRLGIFWTFIHPLFIAGIYYFAFHIILDIEVEGAPFSLYLISVVFPWQCFQQSVLSMSAGLLDHKSLLKDSNIPYALIPVSLAVTHFLLVLPSFLVVIIASAWMLEGVSFYLVLLPFTLCIQLLFTIGLGLLFSCLNMRWRDMRYLLDMIVAFLFYLTPSFYSLQFVMRSLSESLYELYLWNPFVGLVSQYRLALLNGYEFYLFDQLSMMQLFVFPAISGLFVFFVGVKFFNSKKEWVESYLSL